MAAGEGGGNRGAMSDKDEKKGEETSEEGGEGKG